MIVNGESKIGINELLQLAEETGFTHAAAIDMDALVFRPEVREMCSADRCGSYGRSWSCPPAAGSLDTISKRAAKYGGGIIVQTSGELASEFDMESIRGTMAGHLRSFSNLVRQVKQLLPDCLPMGAGACRLCRSCTYPDRPCRHPDKMYPSMEAYGLLVSDVCLRSGLGYNYGPGTITYTSCILID